MYFSTLLWCITKIANIYFGIINYKAYEGIVPKNIKWLIHNIMKFMGAQTCRTYPYDIESL